MVMPRFIELTDYGQNKKILVNADHIIHLDHHNGSLRVVTSKYILDFIEESYEEVKKMLEVNFE